MDRTFGASRRVRFDGFELDLASGELWRAGVPVELPPQPARVLVVLVERAGRLVGRQELRERIWGDAWCEWEVGLHQAVRRIRSALGESAAAPRYVETLPRRGYRFVGRIESLPAAAGASGRLPVRLAAAGLLLAALGGAAWMARPQGALPRAAAVAFAPETPLRAEAERLYREGAYLLGRGRLDAAEDRFRRAAASAPEWAAPWSGIAEIELARPGEERPARARRAIERALARDPDGADAWRQLARLRLWEAWDWAGARGALERALTTDPGSADGWQLLAALETVLGREEAALAAARRALLLDPVSTARRVDLGWTLYYFGHVEQAVAECRRSLELEPDSVLARRCLLQSLILAGRPEEAGELFASSSEPDANDPVAAYLWRQIAAVESTGSCASAAGETIPRLLLGDAPGALDALVEGARGGRGWEVPFARVDPLLAPWRSDPRFGEVVERLVAGGERDGLRSG